MRKEKHTAIWKNIVKSTFKQLLFLHKEFDFEKPRKSNWPGEDNISVENDQYKIYTTIFFGDLTPPTFIIENKQTKEQIKLDTLHDRPKINSLGDLGVKETAIYLDYVENQIRKFLE